MRVAFTTLRNAHESKSAACAIEEKGGNERGRSSGSALGLSGHVYMCTVCGRTHCSLIILCQSEREAYSAVFLFFSFGVHRSELRTMCLSSAGIYFSNNKML